MSTVCGKCRNAWTADLAYCCGTTWTSATKDSNPKDNAATTRLDLSLFPSSARIYGALAMTEGALKYGGYNFRKVGVRGSVYVASTGRHMDKYWNGEECDPTTGIPHLASALAGIAVLIDATEQGNLNDDRPPKQDTAGLLHRCEADVKRLQALFPNPASRYTEK